MIELKRYAALGGTSTFTQQDRKVFQTVGFDPNELLQLQDMNNKELTHLMIFCGIRVFNGTPVCILGDDDMRLAYVLWRANLVNEKKLTIAKKAERGMKWINYMSRIAEVLGNRSH